MGNTYTVTVRGNAVTFTSAFDNLSSALANLPVNRSPFALSLRRQSETRALSSRQVAWVHKLATEAAQPSAPQPSAPPDVANLGAIVAMMEHAAAAQKRHPKIELRRGDLRVMLARAGDRSRLPGTVSVTDGRPYGENQWFGRIDRDGSFRAARAAGPEVVDLLRDLAADPLRVAAQHGVATGSCCFCNRELSTAESRTAGYGPVCAERFGLAWGDTAAADEADRAARAEL